METCGDRDFEFKHYVEAVERIGKLTEELEQDRSIEWLGHIEGQLGIIKVHVKSKQPVPVILLSYDNAGALRTVRLDDKGRIVVSP